MENNKKLKIYATEVDSENFDYSCYYDEDMAEEDGIWAGGNRDFAEINPDLRKDVSRALESAYHNLYDIEDFHDVDINIEETLNYWFKKSSGDPLTEAEQKTLLKLVGDFFYCTSADENGIICKVLTIITGKVYKEGVIRGYSQGDWLKIIYPEEIQERLSWIEAVLFATGSEFAITTEAIEEKDLDDAEVYYDYTNLYKPEEIKAWIAENNHVGVDDVEIRLISNRRTQYIYEYDKF